MVHTLRLTKTAIKSNEYKKITYEVIMGDDFIYVKGKAVITVEGNFNLKTATVNIEAAAINMAADGAIKIKGSSVNIESTGSMDLKAVRWWQIYRRGSFGSQRIHSRTCWICC